VTESRLTSGMRVCLHRERALSDGRGMSPFSVVSIEPCISMQTAMGCKNCCACLGFLLHPGLWPLGCYEVHIFRCIVRSDRASFNIQLQCWSRSIDMSTESCVMPCGHSPSSVVPIEACISMQTAMGCKSFLACFLFLLHPGTRPLG
jgi:hypothetical protein